MATKKLPKITYLFLVIVLGSIMSLIGPLNPNFAVSFNNSAARLNLNRETLWFLMFGVGTLLLFIFTYLKEEDSVLETMPVSQSERSAVIQGLTESYQNRIAQKLDKRILLGFRPKYTNEGTSKKNGKIYFSQDVMGERQIQSGLQSLLNKYLYLLIVGDQGVGKTTLLLELAVAYLDLAKNTTDFPYPVILNLSSWQKDKTFEEWMTEVLVNGNGFSRKLALEVVEKKEIVPFLDGFDEIPDADLRRDCLCKIRDFLPKYEPRNLLICSRTEAYKEVSDDAPIKAEVEIRNLTSSQLKRELHKIIDDPVKMGDRPFANTNAAQNMLLLMSKHPSFTSVLGKPFFFNLAAQIFSVKNDERNLPNEEAEVERYLVEEFVNNKLSLRSNEFPSKEKNEHYLAWLAAVLFQNKVVSFELDYFQSTLLRRPKVYNFLIGLSAAIVISIGFSPMYGLLFGLLYGVRPGYVRTEDKRSWIWRNLWRLKSWKRILRSSIKNILYCGLIPGLASVFLLGPVQGIIAGAIFGLIGGITASLLAEVSKITYFSKTQTPYQRLRKGIVFRILFSAALFFTCNFVLFFSGGYALSQMYGELIICSVSGAAMGFIVTPYFRHIVLRLCLYLEGSIPLRCVGFLNYAADELRIIEREGGQWRFRHPILERYLTFLYYKKTSG